MSIHALSRELLHTILSFCDLPDVLAIAQASKELRALALPIIYRTVDLSVHNRPLTFDQVWWGVNDFVDRPGDALSWEDDCSYPRFLLELLAVKQQSFLDALLQNPGLGAHVRTFVWTIRDNWDPAGPLPAKSEDERPRFKAVSPDTRIWEAFQHLTNVQDLDLCSLHNSWDELYLRTPPPNLFSTIRQLRLSGVMYRQMVNCILDSINTSNLKSLELSALQDPGRFKDKVPGNLNQPGYPGWNPERRQLNLNVPETKDLVHPGPMRGILPALHGQCTALRSLSIRKPSIFADIDQFHHITDDQFVQEFALFLRSVKPTLQRLDYEIGHPFDIDQTDIESPPQVDWFGNQQFVRYLLPVLLEPEWPAIQAVRISGVSWMGDDDDRVEKNLKQVLGEAVSLEIIKLTERPCEFFFVHGLNEKSAIWQAGR